MIHRIFSDLPSFKNLEFWPGLNILLADRAQSGTDLQTRNRAGKSSLIQIIHFLMGSSARPESAPFDGVDERQVARALQLGAETAEECGWQYIITLNSDDVPSRFPDDFDFESHVLPIRLTDETEDGGLFGFRF